MKTFNQFIVEHGVPRSYKAFHGTKSPQLITSFSPGSSFSPNVEMAKRYIKQGGSYSQDGPNRLYKVEVSFANPSTYSTQDRLRTMISNFYTDPKFKRQMLGSGIDALVYGIPNMDSDCVIVPIKSSQQIKILDVKEFTDLELEKGEYLNWAGS